MTHRAVIVYVDSAQLKRQAGAWARRLQKESGVRIGQPASAYVRWLLEQDRKGGKHGA